MKTNTRILSLILALTLLFSLGSCFLESGKKVPTDLWSSATYTEDATVGSGAKTVTVKITAPYGETAEEKSIILTVNTSSDTLGDALFENRLINDSSFFDTLNGMKADYSVNEGWWKLMVDGRQSFVGVGDIEISGGEHFELVYTIGM